MKLLTDEDLDSMAEQARLRQEAEDDARILREERQALEAKLSDAKAQRDLEAFWAVQRLLNPNDWN